MRKATDSVKNKKSDIVKQQSPKVSVIIPIYNVDRYLRECLDSVIAQTLKEIEIICVNDGSTDDSLEIVKEYAKRDERIVVITGPNRGYGNAINNGLKSATGEFVGIVESDDYILPEMYEELYKVSQKYPELDMVKSDAIRFINSGNENERTYIKVCNRNLYDRVLSLKEEPDCYNAYMINTTGIYRRRIIVDNGIRLNESKGAAYQDNGLWFQLFVCSRNIMFINKAFYMYRTDRAESSTNCTTFENALCIFGEWQYILDVLKSYGQSKIEECRAVYSLRCYGSFYYHFTRVLDEYKMLFLNRFSEEMKKLSDEGILRTDLFSQQESIDLLKIIENPTIFYYEWCKKNILHIFDKQIDNYLSVINRRVNDVNLIYSIEDNLDIKVSVIIPVYNAEKTIQKCVRNVTNQSLKEIEIICVDDGSSDKSLPILILLSKQYKNIRVLSQNNLGAGEARNAALRVANGEFISFVDPDDLYAEDDALECLYNKAIENEVDICAGNTIIVENNEIKLNESMSFSKDGVIQYSDWQGCYG